MSTLFAHDDDTKLVNRFIEVSEQLTTLFRKEALDRVPYTAGTSHYNKLSPERKKDVIHHLEFYLDLCTSQLAAGEPLRNSKRLTWRALSALRLVPPSNVFDHFTENCVIEIYTRDHFQIFRTLEFFDVCGYSLEELFCLEWWLLFERSEADFQLTMNLATRLLAGEFPSGVNPHHQPYILVEAMTEEKTKIRYELTHVAPLMRNRKVEALLCIENASIL